MTPFFFGEREAQLFGAYHAARGRDRAAGIVLCAPGPQESMQAHWALRRLAVALATQGYHVLRFDWSGTGDSAGDLETASIARWTDDVGRAAAEIGRLAEIRAVSFLGMRLGAAIAARAVADGLTARDLVLWEPVVRGQTYLAELEAAQASRLADRTDALTLEDELLGFAMPRAMRREIEEIDLRRLPLAASRIAIFHAEPDADIDALIRSAAHGGSPIDARRVASEPGEDRGDREVALLSTRVLAAMTAHLAGPS